MTNNAKQIWEKLYNIKITESQVEIRDHGSYELTYLKWSIAWSLVLGAYPDAFYEFKNFEFDGKTYDCMYYIDGSASVHCVVNINGIKREMWLPVMDSKNFPIKNPSSTAINKAKMRCLVKTLAMFGLGLQIYQGDFEPDEEPVIQTPKPPENMDEIVVYELLDDKGAMLCKFGTLQPWCKKFVEQAKIFESNGSKLSFLNNNKPLFDRINIEVEDWQNTAQKNAALKALKQINETYYEEGQNV